MKPGALLFPCWLLPLACLSSWSLACERFADPPPPSRATRSGSTSASASASQTSKPLAPTRGEPTLPVALRTESWLIELPLADFGAAFAAIPQGVRTPRPVVVALHGYGDRPDWQCGAWTGVTGGRVFVLCPRGVELARPLDNFSFGSVEQTEREVLAGLKALRQRFPEHVAPQVILVGYSLGAQRAAHLASRSPATFKRVALIEGGTKAWSAALSARFSKGGGERLLLVCSQLGCEPVLQGLARHSQREQTSVRVDYLGPLGHTMGPKVTARLKAPWAWLADGLL